MWSRHSAYTSEAAVGLAAVANARHILAVSNCKLVTL
jgi:hypothetical protein